jgi:integrase
LPIAEIFARYLDESMTEDRASRRDAEGSIQKMMAYFDREHIQWVADLDWETQGRYMAWRETTFKVGNETISRDMSVLKAALNWSHKRGMLAQVPHVRMRPKSPPRSRFLSPEEARRLLDACEEPHLELFIRVSLSTLARPGAILALTTDRVDLNAGLIDFLPEGQRQSHKRRPIVPIAASLRPHLEQAIRDSLSGHVIEYLGRPVKSIKKCFHTTRKRAGLDDPA